MIGTSHGPPEEDVGRTEIGRNPDADSQLSTERMERVRPPEPDGCGPRTEPMGAPVDPGGSHQGRSPSHRADTTELDPRVAGRNTDPASELAGTDDSMASLLLHLAGAPMVRPEELKSHPVQEGERVGRFQVLRELGEGGFATVYEALDLSLGRKVAIKVLRMRRRDHNCALKSLVELFHQEAATAASLNHPSIVTLHDYGSFEGVPYLILERLEGETLQQRLKHGPLDAAEALALMDQVASALAYAHKEGVVHRDLKPSNIFLASDGRVKLLDLGLAKVIGAMAGIPPGPEGSNVGPPPTGLDGAGTPGYMAPEQWLRKPQDARTDVFAAGVVFFQLLTGTLPFDPPGTPGGRSLLDETPAPPAVAKGRNTHPALVDVVARCLQRDPGSRFADGSALRDALQTVRQRLSGEGEARGARSVRRWRWAAAVLTVLFLFGVALTFLRSPRPDPLPASPARHRRLTYVGDAATPALSPDGSRFAFVTNGQILVRPTSGGPATELFRSKHVYGLRWTPDGQTLLFYTWTDAKPRRHLVAGSGGGIERLPDDSARRVSSTPGDGKIRVPDPPWTGRRAAVPGTFAWMEDVDLSSTGRTVVVKQFFGRYGLWITEPGRKSWRRVYVDRQELHSPRWTPRGDAAYVLRFKEGPADLIKVPIPQANEIPRQSAPTVLVTGLQMGPVISLSANGRSLLYTRVSRFSHIAVAPIPPSPSPEPLVPQALSPRTLVAHSPAVSPDGRWLAFSVGERPVANIFLMPLAGGPPRQVTFGRWWNVGAAWSPDGTHLAFGSLREAQAHVWTLRVADSEQRPHRDARLDTDGNLDLSWAPSSWILHQLPGKQIHRGFDPALGTARLIQIRNPPGSVYWPRVSPDGQMVAVYRELKGYHGLCVVPMDGGVSRRLHEGRVLPIGWSTDGKSIYLGKRSNVQQNRTTQIVRILRIDATSGEVQATIPISPDKVVTYVTMTADETAFIFTTEETRSDVWLVEGFDPASRP